jgi:basic membrane protein A
MKKSGLLAVVLGSAAILTLGACNGTATSSSAVASSAGSSAAASSVASSAASGTIDLAMITDVGQIDDGSFNQYTYVGVQQYATDHGLTQAYFRPTEDSTQARLDSISQAVARGAKIVVCPGYLFETAIYEAQTMYQDVSFLLLDGEPHDSDYVNYFTASNVHCILYKEYEPGYLAGYAAVEEGYTKLGFEGGMAVPAVEKYGFGYVSGIIDAANAKNIDVTVQYDYAGTFNPSDTIVTTATGWYNAGTQVIFSCGGSIFKSVVSAAESTTKKVIGVDVDQYSQAPDVVITSAEKKLQESTYASLTSFYGNNKVWPTELAGKTALVGAKEGMVGLPTDSPSWTFTTFTLAQYNALFAAMAASDTYTGVAYGATVTLAKPGVSLSHLTIDYGSSVTNFPITK